MAVKRHSAVDLEQRVVAVGVVIVDRAEQHPGLRVERDRKRVAPDHIDIAQQRRGVGVPVVVQIAGDLRRRALHRERDIAEAKLPFRRGKSVNQEAIAGVIRVMAIVERLVAEKADVDRAVAIDLQDLRDIARVVGPDGIRERAGGVAG